MSTSASSSAIFNGTSRFSTDFQQVLTRAVGIASLPITQLTNQTNHLQSKASELTTLGSAFTSLQTAITAIQNAAQTGSLSASVSDNSIAQITIGSGANPSSYSLEVTDLGAYTNTVSADGLTTVTDPAAQNIAASGSFTLTVNGVDTTITPQSNTLSSLVQEINAQPALHIQASIVNVGSGTAPDFRLSLQSTNLAADSVQLTSGSTQLLNTVTTGTPATYLVDGLTNPISSSTRTVTLAPGVTANLSAQSASGVAARITVSQQTQGISTALSSFVNAYNSAADELAKNRGSGGGALAGNSLIGTLGNTLQQLGNFHTGASGIGALTDLGITYDTTGHLSFDASVFASSSGSNLAALNTFFGTSDSGGFLQTANNLLTSIEDPATGIIPSASLATQIEINATQQQISTDQARVSTLTTNLQHQLAKSDALVAALEQSYTVLSGIIQAQTTNAQSLNNGL